MKSQVTLVEAIRELRAQLAEAAKEGKGATIRFSPKSVEVELGISFRKEAEAGGGFKLLSLVDLSAKGKMGDTNSHKVKLTLEPINPEGREIEISDVQRKG